jgi:hypothetical protein
MGCFCHEGACGKFGYVVVFCLLGPIPGFLIAGSFQLRSAFSTAQRWCTPERCILADDAGCPYSSFFCIESEPETFLTRFKVKVQDVAAGDFVGYGIIDVQDSTTHAACEEAGTQKVALLRSQRNTTSSAGAMPCWDSNTGCCSATQGAGPYVFGGVLLLLGVALLACLCAIGRAARAPVLRLGDADVQGRLPAPPLTEEEQRLAVEQWLLAGAKDVVANPNAPLGIPVTGDEVALAFEDSVAWSSSDRASVSSHPSVDSLLDVAPRSGSR